MLEVLNDTGIKELDELTSVAKPKNGYGEVTEAVFFIIAGGFCPEPSVEKFDSKPTCERDAWFAPPVSAEKAATAQYCPRVSVCPRVVQLNGICRTELIEDMIALIPAPPWVLLVVELPP